MTAKKKLANLHIGFVSPGGSSAKPSWRDQLASGSPKSRGQTEYCTFENGRAARRKLARMLKKKGVV